MEKSFDLKVSIFTLVSKMNQAEPAKVKTEMTILENQDYSEGQILIYMSPGIYLLL